MTLIDRRTFLRAGAGLTACAAARSAVAQDPPKVKGVIWLWMDGGMSPSWTWDPKPEGKARAIGTSIGTIQISEYLKTCAAEMANLSIIRSVSHGLSDHGFATRAMHNGQTTQTEVPLIGTILAQELSDPELPLPPHIVLDGPDLPEPVVFGDRVLPFRLGSLRNPIPNLRRNVDSTRDRDRAQLLLDQNKDWGSRRLQREAERIRSGYEASEKLMNTPLLKAFSTADEPDPLRADYGPEFGEACLAARRLIQAGCGFVEVGLKGWDTTVTKDLVPVLDRGLGTLVRDLAKKNLLRETVVVCATAFGRVKEFGMAPWARGFSVVLAGGALAGGRVYGDTGESGQECKSPVELPDLFATIYKACGVAPDKQYEYAGRKYKYLFKGKPVDDLF
jgi:hypothetical protein